MVPVAEKGGFVPAYDVTLRDGLVFQLNALDLLAYVDEREVRRYLRMLALIKGEIEKTENLAKAERGEDIIVPRERFESIVRAKMDSVGQVDPCSGTSSSSGSRPAS